MELKKKRPLAVLCDKSGNGRCPWSVLKSIPQNEVARDLVFFILKNEKKIPRTESCRIDRKSLLLMH